MLALFSCWNICVLLAKDFTISLKTYMILMLGEEEKLNFHWHMTGRVADLEGDHTSGLGSLSNRGCNGLSMVHTSLFDYKPSYCIHLRGCIFLKLWTHIISMFLNYTNAAHSGLPNLSQGYLSHKKSYF